MRDGGSTGHTGFLYSIVFWRSMSGSPYGPEIWFWFTPFVLDAAHGRTRIRLIAGITPLENSFYQHRIACGFVTGYWDVWVWPLPSIFEDAF